MSWDISQWFIPWECAWQGIPLDNSWWCIIQWRLHHHPLIWISSASVSKGSPVENHSGYSPFHLLLIQCWILILSSTIIFKIHNIFFLYFFISAWYHSHFIFILHFSWCFWHLADIIIIPYWFHIKLSKKLTMGTFEQPNWWFCGGFYFC